MKIFWDTIIEVMDGEEVGELQTTVDKLRVQLREAEAELRRVIESHPRASRGFRRELANVASRMRLGLGRMVPTRELEGAIPIIHTRQREEAFRGYTKSFYVRILDSSDPIVQLRRSRDIVRHRLVEELNKIGGLKFIEILKVTLMKPHPEEPLATRVASSLGEPGHVISHTIHVSSKAGIVNNVEEIAPTTMRTIGAMDMQIDLWQRQGSGWTVASVDEHHLNINRYNPLGGRSWVELPKELQHHMKGLINLKNSDNECFRWCHVRYLHHQKGHPERIKRTDREHAKELDYDGVEFPVKPKHYNRVERQNSIRINVFGYQDKQTFPIYITEETYEKELDLLLVGEHYVLIKDFDRFMYGISKHKGRKHFCKRCLQCFTSSLALEEHKGDCLVINGTQAVRMPSEKEKWVEFRDHHKQLPVPFVVYADFESIVEAIDNPRGARTQQYQRHKGCGYGLKVVCCYDDRLSRSVETYRGEDAIHRFLERLLEIEKEIEKVVKENFCKPLVTSREDEDNFNASVICLFFLARSVKLMIELGTTAMSLVSTEG